MNYIVDKNDIRLDKYIAEQNNEISRSMIQKLIDKGNIKVNGKECKASQKVCLNDKISIIIDEPKETEIEEQDIPLDIIFEDEDIIAINKQKGLVVHPGNGNMENTLVNAIMYKCKDSLSGIGGEIRPGIIHRLDKDTSGVIVVAKNDNAHINISEQIKNRQVKKTYIALVRGNVKENEATINMPIARSMNVRTKMAVNKNGKEAITHFKVIERFEGYSLLEVVIETGRTHQIRVHLAEIGYPVVGDYIYSNGKNPFEIIGQMLHAKELILCHPITNKELRLEAELPNYFNTVLDKLRKGEDESN